MRIYSILISILVAVLMLTGCSGKKQTSPRIPPPPELAKWTVLIYMAADNNLENEALNDVNEMEATAPLRDDPNPSVNVLIQLDRHQGTPDENVTTNNWADTRRYRIFRDNNYMAINSLRVDSPHLGEVDMGNPQSLKSFLTWGMAYAPAEHYLVILWNHGSGFEPTDDYGTPVRSRAICYDDESASSIRDVDLTWALSAGKPIDVLATDACLMGMMEVAYQVREQADYFVTSEELTPAAGYNYSHIVQKLVAECATITPRELSMFMAQDAFQSWGGTGSEQMATSAIDLTRVQELAVPLNALSARLIAVRDTYADDIARARLETNRFGGPQSPTDFRDLYYYLSRLEANVPGDPQVKQYAAETASVLKNDVVIANYRSNDLPFANGLSIYLPNSPVTPSMLAGKAYALFAHSEDYAWDEWLAVQP